MPSPREKLSKELMTSMIKEAIKKAQPKTVTEMEMLVKMVMVKLERKLSNGSK